MESQQEQDELTSQLKELSHQLQIKEKEAKQSKMKSVIEDAFSVYSRPTSRHPRLDKDVPLTIDVADTMNDGVATSELCSDLEQHLHKDFGAEDTDKGKVVMAYNSKDDDKEKDKEDKGQRSKLPFLQIAF